MQAIWISECAAMVLLIILTSLSLSESKVVVFFPVPAVSHTRYHTNIARAVSQMGHEAYVCIPNYLKGSERIDTSGIRVLDYGVSLGNLEQRLVDERRMEENFWEGQTFSPLDHIQLMRFTMGILDETLAGGFYETVKAIHPDLFVVDSIPVMKNVLVVPYKLGIQFAFAGTVHDLVTARVPFCPGATPTPVLSYGNQISFGQRLHVSANYLAQFVVFKLFDYEYDTVAKYAPEMPYISPSDLASRSAIFLAESDPILDYPKPMLPNTKLIGGTIVRRSKPLEEPFKSFVETSPNGVIVVTFGSTILNIPDKIFQKMAMSFDRLDLKVIWRVNASSPDRARIMTAAWIPQNDVLGHRKTRLFVSHCGQNGQYEALFQAVPMLCLPVFADQDYNAQRVHDKGYGIRADIRQITSDELTSLLNELLQNGTYRSNIAQASRLFRSLYKSPMQEAAFWLDHVMEHGGEYMRAASQTMPLYQFFMLDVIAVVCLVLFSSVLALFLICVWCCKNMCYRKRAPKRKSD